MERKMEAITVMNIFTNYWIRTSHMRIIVKRTLSIVSFLSFCGDYKKCISKRLLNLEVTNNSFMSEYNNSLP